MPEGGGRAWRFFMGLCPLIPLVCYFSLLRQRKVTKRKATPTRRAVLSGRHKVAAWAQGHPAPCALGLRHGITAGLCPSERASNAAVGASGGWFSASRFALARVGAYGGGNWCLRQLLVRIATLAHGAPAAVFRTQEVCILTIKYLSRVCIINIMEGVLETHFAKPNSKAAVPASCRESPWHACLCWSRLTTKT